MRFRTARIGAKKRSRGSHRAGRVSGDAREHLEAVRLGVRLRATTSAAAPSLSVGALPAVTDELGLRRVAPNAGLSLASASAWCRGADLRRVQRPSAPFLPVISTGTISAVNLPASSRATAFGATRPRTRPALPREMPPSAPCTRRGHPCGTSHERAPEPVVDHAVNRSSGRRTSRRRDSRTRSTARSTSTPCRRRRSRRRRRRGSPAPPASPP